MKRTLLISVLLLLLSAACRLPSSSVPTPTSAPQSGQRCGDDVCDGPENPRNCPQDCDENGVMHILPTDDTPAEDSLSELAVGEGYRKVTMTGSVSTSINELSLGDFNGDYFEYAGNYSIELWFPMQGGAAVQQRNSMTLTEFNDRFIGNPECRPCEWTLEESAWEPYAFELEATLNLGNILENEQASDELVTQFPVIPDKVLGGVVFCPCPHAAPDDFSDPGAFPQLMYWFMQKLVNPIHLDKTERNTVEDFAISPMYNINIPLETLTYTIVPVLE